LTSSKSLFSVKFLATMD